MRPTNKTAARFEVLEVAVEAVVAVRDTVGRIGRRDGDLERQMRKAGSSVVLNVEEAAARIGRDRVQRFRIAAGSARELRACLRVARAWGYVEREEVEAADALLDRVCAMLWRLTH